MDPILSELNDPQREAILHEEGPLLVIAGAGSGKTRVITRRIAHLVRLGHAPGSILGVTFTNKAAGEMKERVDMLAGSQGVFISTFHSMGARFLRVDGERIGIPRNFTIYDGDDQKALIKDVLKALNLDPTHFRPPAVAEAISRLKTRGTSPEEAAFSGNYFERQVGEVYARYKEQLTANRSLDFDDLLLETLRLFKECDEVRARYQDRFRFILIDEYQDTNKVQYELAKALTGPRMNLCATGDPDQSIYSWRGARVQNILNFEKDFSGTKVIKLEQNYRSTGNILKAASSVIAHNAYRMERNLWTEAPDGDPLTLYSARDEGEEAEFVVRALTELRLEGKPYSESAIFYRTNALSRAFERALSINNIPYTIVGSVAFYERKEIKDLMAYLKLINNPQDSVSFLRIINMPARGIGVRTLNQVREMAILQGKSLLDTVRKICDERLLSARPVSAMAKFLKIFDALCEHPRESVEGLLRQVMEDTGYMNYLKVLEKKESVERVENVNELIYATGEYDRHNPEGSLHGYLEETALIQGIDSWEGDQDKVVLMTLHTAKGLEFNSVFLAGVEEGLMPHMLSLKSDEDLEEERRLFYVGITRARKKLHLSCSASRMRNGSITASRPSRFLQELPEEAVQGNSFARAFSGRVSAYAGQAPAPPRRHEPSGEEDAGPVLEYDQGIAPDFKRGDRVIHPYFGQGQILQVSGSGENARVKVRFQGIGEKLLIVKYAKLKKVL